MLTVIGLSLDVIGAVTLSIGLFRAPMPLYPGYLRMPGEAAEDRAYGTTGALYLIAGFVFQGLAAFDLCTGASDAAKARAAVVTLIGGTAVIDLLYGLAYIAYLRRIWASGRGLLDSSTSTVPAG